MLKMTDYTLSNLIDRAYSELEEKSKNAIGGKLTMVMPIVQNKQRKTFIVNFKLICDRISKDKYEVKKYLDSELRCDSSLNENDQLIISGFFKSNNIKKVLVSYIKSYVLCRECKSSDTELFKKNRIHFMKCNTCKSEKSIN